MSINYEMNFDRNFSLQYNNATNINGIYGNDS